MQWAKTGSCTGEIAAFEIAIRNPLFRKTPKVDVIFDRFRLLPTNLTNSHKLSKTLHAHIEMEARPLRTGDLRAKTDLDLAPRIRLSISKLS
ncbi:MAG TPA: hypothetical protein VGF73_03520 [Chthoniobacterales bacterium]|jgi:hypothetical protein